MKKFVIIDGNAIIHRAYHALPPLTARDGTIVNAVYGFTTMLLKVLNDLKPDYLALSFDVSRKTFRDELYEEYKATRVKGDQEMYDQIPFVYEVVRAFDIPIYLKENYEADDVIGTIVQKIQDTNPKIQNYIVTGDLDTLQLVTKNTNVYALRKGLSDIVIFDEDRVKKRYGFGPEHVVDYKALRGDASDNIPGVAGIGDKTATELIIKIGGIEDIYKKIKKLADYKIKDSVIKKLKDSKKEAELSKKLATIVKDVKGLKFKLSDCKVGKFDTDKLTKLFQKFEFYSLLKRIPGVPGSKLTTVSSNKSAKKKSGKSKLVTVDKKNFKSFIKDLESTKLFACKEILSAASVLENGLVGLVFVTEKGGYYWQPPLNPPLTKGGERSDRGGQSLLKTIFSDKTKVMVGHDLKQLVKALLWNGVEVKNKLFDIMIASYLINSSTRAHDLKSIVLRELGKQLPSGSNQESLFGADPDIIAKELNLILAVQKKYQKQLKDYEDLGLFEKVEMQLIPVLAEMELNGVAIDTKMLEILSKDVARAIDKVIKKIWKRAGKEFNVASSVQLREILFEKMKLPTEGIKKGKTGYSTAASELEKLRGVDPIIELIEEHRELAKLQNTYVDVLPKLINKKTGRIHTNFNQAVTTTGRLSSSDPNLQNIPIRTELGQEVRNAFVAEKGYTLVVADYSQIELRIVASLAQDKKMIEIFKRGEDIHIATAAAINNIPLDEVTKQMRYAAKEVNFGVLYGMGAYGLSWRAKIPGWQAKKFIEEYFKQFSGVKKYIDQTLKFAKKEGYVETLFGRRRYIPELKSDNFQLRSAGERMAINMPIQGTAADLMKLAMIEVYNKIRDQRSAFVPSSGRGEVRGQDVKLILQVHDELVLEVKKGLEKKISKIVKEAMENVVKLRVPVEVRVDVGRSWGRLK